MTDTGKADYIAARASESLSYGDIAYAQSQGWCGSSPDGMGPHRPDDTTDPVTCAECGALIEGTIPADRWEVTFRGMFDAVADWQRQSFATEDEAHAFAAGIAYGDEPAYDVLNVTLDSEPRCDLCGHAMECDREDAEGDHGDAWNGETGNHESCEEETR